MKIALLHYSAPPVVGGVESVLAHQARLMSADGNEVRVIAAQGETWSEKVSFRLLPLVGSRHPAILAAKQELDAGRMPANFEALVTEMMDALREAARGAQVLIAHNVCSLHKNLALTTALWRLNGTAGFPRLVLWHHDLAWTNPLYAAELYLAEPWNLLRRDWPGVTQVVVSEMRQTELAGLLGLPVGRIHVVPNGLDIGAFFKLEEQTLAWLSQLKLAAAAPLLLLPVRITVRKNIELALGSLAHLRKKYPQAALLVTGPLGAHNPANQKYFGRLLELRAQLGLQTSAHFLAEHSQEYLPDAVIADFYRLADALFLPSREEGFGIPLIEAGLSRLPVFCSNIEPLRALGLGDVQYFSPQADPAEVGAQLASYFEHAPLYQFALRTRQQYTWEGIYSEKIRPVLADATREGIV